MTVIELLQARRVRAIAEPRPAPEAARAIDFDAIYEAEHDFVWRCVQRLGVPDDAIDDAVQEVFVVAARKLDSFEHRSSVRTWLFAIARRVVKDIRRGRARAYRRREALAAEHPERGPDGYARSDAARLLHRLLEQLDEPKREVFLLCELEGMTGPEVAEILGLKLPAVYARLRTARLELARLAQQTKHATEEGT
ncbi:RNA polymerase, sigma-24 subunit, ECF subfamily protein [Plesiocystis pacifica SIR-1]|uniref:RNA polymerase, sigma-24 subunit, ECF subfamily protein n=1 Tax=Plesiocystis pacifica SIR-1 TaxID=391625 RepID=A6FYX6_9BACT|nr:RNA polymerase sigma factor [Plesiocystis pacifica]EDM81131.1 RNA polymerase, sigma-24 subunit, ECF subfamily protein [Plesiocystis pacifica SIR-1]